MAHYPAVQMHGLEGSCYISAVKWCSNMNVSKSLLKLRPYHMSTQNLCWNWVWFVPFRFL